MKSYRYGLFSPDAKPLFEKPSTRCLKRRQAAARNRGRFWAAITAVTGLALIILQAAPLRAQQQPQNQGKIPVVGKFTPGPGRQAFSGTVQSLDMKQKVLIVNSRQTQDSEIFPIRKTVQVEALNGKKSGLKALKPGTSVLIYFEQKRGQRRVKNIIVLKSSKRKSQHAPDS